MGIRNTRTTNIQNTFIWDIQELLSLSEEEVDPKLKEILIRLYQNLGDVVNALNAKDSGDYNTSDYICGQLYFSNPANNSTTMQLPRKRAVFRKVINFGPLLITGVNSMPHHIPWTPQTTFTRIYGATTDLSTSAYPIPNVDAVNPISISVDTTNVNITTATDLSAYTVTYAVLEWLQD